jgi:hypothetical protein
LLNRLRQEAAQMRARQAHLSLAHADVLGLRLHLQRVRRRDAAVQPARALCGIDRPQRRQHSAVLLRAGTPGLARELLPLLSRERIDWRDTKRLIEALATIAPRDHEPTIRNLTDIIQKGELNELGLQAALTIQALGDKQGITRLRRALDEQLKKPGRKGEAALYELRGQLGIASEDYNEAYTDFVHAAEKAGETAAMVQKAVAGMMRCEARRKKVQSLIKLIKESGLPAAEIEAIGKYDAVFRETLQQDKVKAALQSLGKPVGGK